MTLATIKLWGTRIGGVSLEKNETVATFQYDPDFLLSGIELSPISMPLSKRTYSFSGLKANTFHGLPGLVSDSLPDKFGNALIDAWLARQGRAPAEFSAVDRLCYIGTRGMGALEYEPLAGPAPAPASQLQVDELVELASEVLTHRNALQASFADESKEQAVIDILRVGTSAGGARAKAVIAWNPATNEVRSGQVTTEDGFEYWLLKFDGVRGNRDKELDDPQGYGCVEYAYSKMAQAAGIKMNACRLFEENGRSHFMTKRFDRLPDGGKLHMQSLCAMAHFDFNAAGAHSYEQAMLTIRQLDLSMDDIEQQFRRMAFNIVARNQDDHVKNIAFLMDRQGKWSLSPAFDVIYSFNPDGAWTSQHQMTMNAKRDHFTQADFDACAKSCSMQRGRAKSILDEVKQAVENWSDFAQQAGVDERNQERIKSQFRLEIPAR
jgi:serine/threonine-protein kinase HipA